MAHFAKRHYETVADILRERVSFLQANPDSADAANRLFELGLVARDFADKFARDNDRFKPDVFAAAAGFRVTAATRFEALDFATLTGKGKR